MVDDWRLALDSKKVTGVIAIELSKAFVPYVIICFLQRYVLMALMRRQLTSCIPTCLVESKEWKSTCLWPYGVDEEAIDFLHSYLSGRKQRVKVNVLMALWRWWGVNWLYAFLLVWSKTKSEGQRSFLGLATGVWWRFSREAQGDLWIKRLWG